MSPRQKHHFEEFNFENAIAACGFGVFNICLLFASLPGVWSPVIEIFTMSYVFPAAECDLQLSLMGKGALNAATFIGTFLSAIPWGFIADTFSRKYILVFGLLADGVVTILSTLSQSFQHLIIFKFFNGLILCGPAAVFLPYICEFHGMKHRLYILMAFGFFNAMPRLVLPLVSRAILPQQKKYNIGSLEFNSWKLLIALTSIPSLLSGLLLLLFPESPKFLMAQGQNEEAMKVFQIIYSINKCQLTDTYPIKTLQDENPEKTLRRSVYSARAPSTLKEKLEDVYEQCKEGLDQFRILLTRSNIFLTLMVICMQFPLLLSVNTLGLWQPQTSAITQEMKQKGYSDRDSCDIIEYALNKTHLYYNKANCEVILAEDAYVDNIVIGAAVLINHIVATFIVRITGNNVLLRIYLVIASVSQFMKYFSPSREVSVFLASVNTSSGVVCATLLLNDIVNLFPTIVRVMSMVVMGSCGRLGGVVGNVLFPLFLSLHCIAIFVFYSVTYLCTFAFSFFLQNTTTDELK